VCIVATSVFRWAVVEEADEKVDRSVRTSDRVGGGEGGCAKTDGKISGGSILLRHMTTVEHSNVV
jgi:hypothetical protein